MEEETIERRRHRKMEEDRNAANQVTINTAVTGPAPEAVSAGRGDLVSRLAKLKQMYDADLITEAEFQAKKSDIIDSI